MNIEYKSSESCQADLKELTAEYDLSTQLSKCKPAMLYEFNKYLPNREEQLLLVITIT